MHETLTATLKNKECYILKTDENLVGPVHCSARLYQKATLLWNTQHPALLSMIIRSCSLSYGIQNCARKLLNVNIRSEKEYHKNKTYEYLNVTLNSCTKHRCNQWVHLHPQAEKKLEQFTGKIRKCTPSTPSAPPGKARVNFGTFYWAGELEVGVVHLVVLDCLLRATTKKGRQLFWRKSAPTDKIQSTN